MCYIQNKDFKATLKSAEEAESFIQGCYLCISYHLQKLFCYFLKLCYFFFEEKVLKICYFFQGGGGGGNFLKVKILDYILNCLPVLKMTSKVSMDQRQTTMSQEMFTFEQKILEINPKSNPSHSAVNDFNQRIVIAREFFLCIKISHGHLQLQKWWMWLFFLITCSPSHLIINGPRLFCTSELSRPLINIQQTIQECQKQMNVFYR